MSAAYKLNGEAVNMLIDAEPVTADFSCLESEAARLVQIALEALDRKSEISKKAKTAAARVRSSCIDSNSENDKS